MSNPHANHQGEPGDTGTAWVLVPREPTEEMIFAASGIRPGDLGYPAKSHMLRFDYRAMIASAPTPPDRVGEEVGRDHVVSARLIPWEPGSLGGVDLTFESGLRVALPLSASEAAPSPDPAGAGGDLTGEPYGTGSREPGPTVPASGFDPSRGFAEIKAKQATLGLGLVDISIICHEGKTGILFSPRAEHVAFGAGGIIQAGDYWPTANDIVLWVDGEGPGVAISYLSQLASAPSPEAGVGGDLASAIAAEIMGLGWALPEFRGDEEEAEEECDRRHGQVQHAVEAVLARSGKLVASTGSGEETKGATPMGSGWSSSTEPKVSALTGDHPSSGWQPIATAPKDGTDVLLYAAAWDWTWGIQMGRFEQGQWFTGEGSVDENEDGFDPDAPIGEDVDLDELTNFGPTHWMPIPEPPASCDRSPKGEDAEGGFVHEGAVAEGQTPEATPQSSPSQTPVDPQMTVEEAKSCHWGGGNDIIWCSTCGAEYAYAKGEERPPCPRTLQAAREVR